MTRRTLSAPIWNTLGSWGRAGAVLLLLWPSACGETRVSTDTRTNWLSSCSDDFACGAGLSCVCGVCTQPCANGQSCSEVNPDAVCLDVPGCEAAGQVCAREGFFDAPTDGSVTSPEDVNGSDSSGTTTEVNSSGAGGTGTTSTSADSGDGQAQETDGALDGSASTNGGASTNGSGSTEAATDDADVDSCDDPDREYVSRDPADCPDLTIDCGVVAEGIGDVPFSDACGCGCEPFVLPPQSDSITTGECAASPPSGTPANFAVLAESELGESTCDNVPPALLRSDADVAQWTSESGCGDIAALVADVDFDTQSVILVGIPERPSTSVAYTVQTIDGTIHVGVAADAYCGGARPSSGYVLVTVNTGPQTPLRVVTETCFAECPDDGGLPVP